MPCWYPAPCDGSQNASSAAVSVQTTHHTAERYFSIIDGRYIFVEKGGGHKQL